MNNQIRGAITAGGVVLLALGAIGSGKAEKKSAPEVQAANAAPVASAQSPAAPTAPASPDAIGTTKTWSDISVTLKEAAIQGKVAKITFLLKNGKTEEEKISSMLYFHMTSEEGDIGELDIMGGGVSCDGAVPPQGILKCKLAYKFEQPPKELTIRVGAGVVSDTVYFKVKPPTK